MKWADSKYVFAGYRKSEHACTTCILKGKQSYLGWQRDGGRKRWGEPKVNDDTDLNNNGLLDSHSQSPGVHTGLLAQRGHTNSSIGVVNPQRAATRSHEERQQESTHTHTHTFDLDSPTTHLEKWTQIVKCQTTFRLMLHWGRCSV